MKNWKDILSQFILQAHKLDLKTTSYPKEFYNLRVRISFGMGAPARVPWIAFITSDMAVSKGFYPVYLYYKKLDILILAYGVSETEEYGKSWPTQITNDTTSIKAYFDTHVPRYSDSFIFKSYIVKRENNQIQLQYANTKTIATDKDIESDLLNILDQYKKITSNSETGTTTEISTGLFYMEKQLEDFLIQNWPHTELGKNYDLIIKDGELVSQQYKTDIGPIDILVKDKKSGSYVVIELKKNQSSDDTAGQLTRYMGWIKKHKNDINVKGIIIAGQNDEKLIYALTMIPNTELLIYEVNFKLRKTSP